MATVEQAIPPLTAGDKLTRAEFLRRWEGHPEIKRAELIRRIVYMPSPVSAEHGDTENEVAGWLWSYAGDTPGTKASNNATIQMLGDAPQPDVHLRLLRELGGKAWVQGAYVHGAPELVAEVCRSSAAYDLNQKLELYEDAGVEEYVAVLLFEGEVRWHRLGPRGYEVLQPGADGVLRSVVFPGLWLAGQALLTNNTAALRAVLQQGLNSQEHRDFVGRLAAKKP